MGRMYCRSFSVGLFVILLLTIPIIGQQTRPIEGLRENTPRVHALINAKVVIAPGQIIEKGTVVIRDGVIVQVGANIVPPADARIWDYSGKTIYPGFIEPYFMPMQPRKGQQRPSPSGGNYPGSRQRETRSQSTGPSHWNPKVHPERSVLKTYKPDEKLLKTYHQLGFTTALLVPPKGIFRGSSALIHLKKGDLHAITIRKEVAQHLAFERGGFRSRTYPGSLMGAIALIRQTFLDARWYRDAWNAYNLQPNGQEPPEVNLALEALQPVIRQQQPIVFAVENERDFLRAHKLFKEFQLNGWIKGSGTEYRLLSAIRETRLPVVLPVNYPQKLKLDTPEDALNVTLQELQHWEAAPDNARWLTEAGLPIAFTTHGLKKTDQFWDHIRLSVKRGLSPETALAGLTTQAARILGVDDRLGSVANGKLANLVITDGDIFDRETQIIDVWVAGERIEVQQQPPVDPRGIWKARFNLPDGTRISGELEIKGKLNRLQGTLTIQDQSIRLDRVILEFQRLGLVFKGDSLGYTGFLRLSASLLPGKFTGKGELPDGRPFTWEAQYIKPIPKKARQAQKPTLMEQPAQLPTFPPGAYGRKALPEQPEYILIKNATIWTSGPQGILENADMLIKRGKIIKLGQNLTAPKGSVVIEATGKHVTPGLIDAHSHTGIDGGVNEATQAVTAEVRIQDVINSHHIGFYRQLAGGLTMSNLLHGSANPIGGQNAVVKLRWGAPPDAFLFQPAPPGIKFALGENVKQSNWGDQFTTRYPQTRMGVEQIIRDRFQAALDYKKQWEQYQKLPKKVQRRTIPPRRDLEMETLLEILEGKRWVHSHSYRQDEILMLIRVAEEFGFTIGVFQHVLEGYKIAEAIQAHGAGASTFSDWWAYKFEVYDAIPHNGALMHNVGVVVSYNSDSNELARRLNTEAAKAVKYGGLSPEEALKLVTINPARQLKVDHRVGSLEPGKDADFVIWNGNPLSTYTICEQTWIEGRKYFDREADLQMRKAVEKERARLIQKYLAVQKEQKKKGMPGKSNQLARPGYRPPE